MPLQCRAQWGLNPGQSRHRGTRETSWRRRCSHWASGDGLGLQAGSWPGPAREPVRLTQLKGSLGAQSSL